MTRLDNSQFLKQVETLTQSNNGKSSIYLTQKRLSPSLSSITTTTTAEDESINDLPTNVITPTPKTTTTTTTINNDSKYPLLIRLSMNSSDNKIKTKTKTKTDSKVQKKKERVKISTVVELDQLNEFWDQYIQILKSGFYWIEKEER
ncbi:RNA-binding signal recognition particle subunit [Candida albicans SC5314]|uniref:Signal recognition particle subunit SRP14 n=1 Tax=Candida albicans (strain SC5314 / ATCC MYA-2876) TaxID=237561 RepID=A0A1D8PLY2_CANAL|nr:RNA-binding signal recognition particle subunit [Candida albicans SC5314]AOW29145.1 RNA-binding signal recognition particle subunit [Candida albicans SC5314]|eukprot:XP_019330921.1 RNA-binding signal recognition particle subunit [Candida albicans SC5314]